MSKESRIYCAVQILDDNAEEYVMSVARVAGDLGLGLVIMSAQSVISPTQAPATITGEGVTAMSGSSMHDRLDDSREILTELANKASAYAERVDIHIDLGLLADNAADLDQEENALLWTVNVRSQESLLNDLLGTVETDLSKSMNTAVLNIPEGHTVKVPEKILTIISDSDGILNVRHINKISQHLGCATDFLVELPDSLMDARSPLDYFRRKINMPFDHISGKIEFVEKNDMKQKIEDKTDSEEIDWIALTGTDKNIIYRLYSNLNTNHLVLSSEIPVLIY